MQLVTVSPFDSIYALAQDQGYDVEYKKFKKSDVQRVEGLALDIGKREEVKTERDWEAVDKIIKFYWATWPEDAQEFYNIVPDIRGTRASGGYSKSRETKYLGALPLRLLKCIKIFFPKQQWDKNFSNKFVKRFKIFGVGGYTNLAPGKVQI